MSMISFAAVASAGRSCSSAFNRPFSFYQVLYAGLGISQAIFTFLLCVSSLPSWQGGTDDMHSGLSMDFVSIFVSRNLHHDALHNVFYASMSFFDATVSYWPFVIQ